MRAAFVTMINFVIACLPLLAVALLTASDVRDHRMRSTFVTIISLVIEYPPLLAVAFLSASVVRDGRMRSTFGAMIALMIVCPKELCVLRRLHVLCNANAMARFSVIYSTVAWYKWEHDDSTMACE